MSKFFDSFFNDLGIYREEDKCSFVCMCIFFLTVYFSPVIYEEVHDGRFCDWETRETLSETHERAVSAVDTINFDGTPIDVKAARKDSAQAVRQTRKAIRKFYRKQNSEMFDRDRQGYIVRINSKKAMSDPKFADAHRKYYKAIQQLEMARRQGKLK